MKKIVIIGPESTGKTTLTRLLSEHYNVLWVPEFAREYLQKEGMDYTYDDLLTVAMGQVNLEETYSEKAQEQNKQKLFLDTDMYVMKVWCEFVFEKCHNWIINQVVNRKYDLYLLCNVDMPWVKDELREYPDLLSRKKLYHIYKDIMINQPVPWVDISGSYEERLKKAINGIETHLS